MNLGEYIQLSYPGANTQMVTDLNEVGTYIRNQVDYLYVNKAIQDAVTFNNLLASISDPISPAKDKTYLSYYLLRRFSEAFDIQQGLALAYLLVPNPKPFPYVAGQVGTYMKLNMISDVVSVFGPGSIVTPQLSTLIDVYDTFIVDVYLTT